MTGALAKSPSGLRHVTCPLDLCFLHGLQGKNFFWPCRVTCRILAVKVLSPNHWTTREFPPTTIFIASDVRKFKRGGDRIGLFSFPYSNFSLLFILFLNSKFFFFFWMDDTSYHSNSQRYKKEHREKLPSHPRS